MALLEKQLLINARGSTVWEIVTDVGNLTVWNSGITAVTGEIRNGGSLRLTTRQGGRKNFRIRVEQIPGEVMTWTWVAAPWLGSCVRTFKLTPHVSMTLLNVRDEITGPLRGVLRSPFSAKAQDVEDFVTAVKDRAEIFG